MYFTGRLRFNNFDPNAEVILPGVAVQGASLDKATPERIPFPADKSAVAISTLTGCEARAEMDEATTSRIYEAMSKIIATCPNSVTANIEAHRTEVKSNEELQLALEASASLFGFFKTKLGGGLTEKENYRHFLVVVDQLYYTMVYDRPTDFEHFFRSDVSANDLSDFVGDGNPACYISSVSYGAKFYLLVEAEEESQTIEASICAHFFGNGGCGSFKKLSELKNVKTTCYALGGKADELIQAALSTNSEEVRTFLSRSVDIRNGAPISYQVRSILTDDVVKNGVATKYTVKDCKPIAAASENMTMWYEGSSTGVVLNPGNKVKTWKDRSGHGHHAEYITIPPSIQSAPIWTNNGINGNGALEFAKYIFSLYGWLPSLSKLDFPGTTLKDSDYSLVTVLSSQPLDTFCLLAGSGNYGYTNAEIFFRNDSIFYTNNFQASNSNWSIYDPSVLKCKIPSQYSGGSRVFTFRFSKSTGLSIFVNGEKIGEDTSLTTALGDYPGAYFGGLNIGKQNYGVVFRLGEFQAYTKALSETEIENISSNLMVKYGL